MNFHIHQVISRYLVFYVFRKIKIGPPGQLLICNVRTKNVPRHILAPAAVAYEHLPYTPKCASSRSVFCFTGTQFPVKQKTVRKHFGLRTVFYYIIIRLGLLDPNPDLPES